MKILKVIIYFILGILIVPIFSILVLSFQNNNGELLKWYQFILVNEEFLNAFLLSGIVSILTAIFCVLFSFIISLSWFDNRSFFILLIQILIIGLLPPDIIALSINKTLQLFGFYNSNLLSLIIGLIYYTFPFSVLLFWTRYYFIEQTTLIAAKDIGLKRFFIITKIIWPVSKATALTCFIFIFLLAFNEYPRTYYLSGSFVMLSEYLNGKLNSGADESIYAGGSITIIMTAIVIVGYSILQYFIKRNHFVIDEKQ